MTVAGTRAGTWGAADRRHALAEGEAPWVGAERRRAGHTPLLRSAGVRRNPRRAPVRRAPYAGLTHEDRTANGAAARCRRPAHRVPALGRTIVATSPAAGRLVPLLLLAAAVVGACGGRLGTQSPGAPSIATTAPSLAASGTAPSSVPVVGVPMSAQPPASAASPSPEAATTARRPPRRRPRTATPTPTSDASSPGKGPSAAELDGLLRQVDTALGAADGALSQATSDLDTKGE